MSIATLPDVRVDDEGDRLMTVAEGAEYLRCLQSYLRRLLHERRLSYVRVGGRMIRLRRSDLDALLETVEARRPHPTRSLGQIGRLPATPASSTAASELRAAPGAPPLE